MFYYISLIVIETLFLFLFFPPLTNTGQQVIKLGYRDTESMPESTGGAAPTEEGIKLENRSSQMQQERLNNKHLFG